MYKRAGKVSLATRTISHTILYLTEPPYAGSNNFEFQIYYSCFLYLDMEIVIQREIRLRTFSSSENTQNKKLCPLLAVVRVFRNNNKHNSLLEFLAFFFPF